MGKLIIQEEVKNSPGIFYDTDANKLELIGTVNT